MYSINYIVSTDTQQLRLISVTTPSELTAIDIARCLVMSGACKNVRVWHRGESLKF